MPVHNDTQVDKCMIDDFVYFYRGMMQYMLICSIHGLHTHHMQSIGILLNSAIFLTKIWENASSMMQKLLDECSSDLHGSERKVSIADAECLVYSGLFRKYCLTTSQSTPACLKLYKQIIRTLDVKQYFKISPDYIDTIGQILGKCCVILDCEIRAEFQTKLEQLNEKYNQGKIDETLFQTNKNTLLNQYFVDPLSQQCCKMDKNVSEFCVELYNSLDIKQSYHLLALMFSFTYSHYCVDAMSAKVSSWCTNWQGRMNDFVQWLRKGYNGIEELYDSSTQSRFNKNSVNFCLECMCLIVCLIMCLIVCLFSFS